MMEFIVGVDPGKEGAICLLGVDKLKGNSQFTFWDNKELLEPELFLEGFSGNFIAAIESSTPTKLVLEKVHSLGNMSAKSNFSFGSNVGIGKWCAEVLARAYEIPLVEVTPQKWQKEIGFPSLTKEEKAGMDQNKRTKAQKQRAFEYALKLYPEAEQYLFTERGRMLDGRVDSLLIAHWGITTE